MPVPPAARRLLEAIGAVEAPTGWNAVWAGIRPRDRPPRPPTAMTVGEVLAWQASIDRLYPSEAVGRFQIMEDTLRELVRAGVLDPAEPFGREAQERAAFALMRRRGWDAFARGALDARAFGDRLAQEWAALPVLTGPRRGRSHYDGDGLNRALIGAEEWERELVEAQSVALGGVPGAGAAEERPGWPFRLLAALLRILGRLLGRTVGGGDGEDQAHGRADRAGGADRRALRRRGAGGDRRDRPGAGRRDPD